MQQRLRCMLAAMAAGFLSGLLVLGAGGRFLMRLLAYATPEPPRFTWVGTLQIIGAGMAWGLLTGPLLIPLHRLLRQPPKVTGPVFGALVLALAIPPFAILSGFNGSIVAPASFLWLSALTFPLLFFLHGVVVSGLFQRYRFRDAVRRELSAGPMQQGSDSTHMAGPPLSGSP